MPKSRILHGDCLKRLKSLPANSVDSMVTDPPYGLSKEPVISEVMQHWINGDTYQHGSKGFMGKSWDSFVPGPEYWLECFRVMKPGAYALVFAGTRTWDLMSVSLRFAGFRLVDTCQWIYGSGFPKSHSISKAIDRMNGDKRPVHGRAKNFGRTKLAQGKTGFGDFNGTWPLTSAASAASAAWDGFGTQLKPAWEPVLLVQKPCERGLSIAENVLKHGVGCLNIDASRVGTQDNLMGGSNGTKPRKLAHGFGNGVGGGKLRNGIPYVQPSGRWPANLLLTCCGHDPHLQDCAVAELDRQSIAGGMHSAGKPRRGGAKQSNDGALFGVGNHAGNGTRLGDSGGASRFFYIAKPSRRERNLGCEGLDGAEIIQVSIGPWEKAALKAQLQVDTGRSVPKVIAASGTLSNSVCAWNTMLFGSSTSGRSRRSTRSTTRTKTSSTIESKTLSWLARSNTNASIQDANSLTVSGGSLAGLVRSLSTSGTITNGLTASAPNARSARSVESLEIRSIGGSSGNGHPTIKPTRLMRYLITMITPPGGTCLDPFLGSGTTAVAAKQAGFRFIGIERESEYVKICRARVRAALPLQESSA